MNSKTINSIKNNKAIIRVCLALLFFSAGTLLAKSGKAQQKQQKPGVFYAITGNGLKDTSYLFGTYHLIKSSYFNEVPGVKKALQGAKGVVVEVVIDSAKLPQLQAMGLLKDKTLSTMLQQSFIDSLDAELKASIGVGLPQLNQLKPINVTITLSMVHLFKNNAQKLNQYSGLPLDMYVADYAKKNAKTVTPFETAEEQMDMLFNKTSEAEQIKGLKMFIRHKDEMVKLSDELLNYWFTNDLDEMDALYNKTITLSGEADYLLKDRNMKWIAVLPGLLKNERQFIAVGALHLAGPNGLVAQLQKQGYQVTPLKLKP